MSKPTNIKLDTKNFVQYCKAVSGLFLATAGEAITETELKLIWSIKAGFDLNKQRYISKRLRTQLAHAMELKPQTLYNRLADLKRKGVLVKRNNKMTLSPIFNVRTNVIIVYDENRRREESIPETTQE
jgi:hypothetical protein